LLLPIVLILFYHSHGNRHNEIKLLQTKTHRIQWCVWKNHSRLNYYSITEEWSNSYARLCLDLMKCRNIFRGGSTQPLTNMAGFCTREEYGPWPLLVFQCPSLGLPPSCLGTSKQGRGSGPTLLLFWKACPLPVLFSFKAKYKLNQKFQVHWHFHMFGKTPLLCFKIWPVLLLVASLSLMHFRNQFQA
jgi:hypothetical protein